MSMFVKRNPNIIAQKKGWTGTGKDGGQVWLLLECMC